MMLRGHNRLKNCAHRNMPMYMLIETLKRESRWISFLGCLVSEVNCTDTSARSIDAKNEIGVMHLLSKYSHRGCVVLPRMHDGQAADRLLEGT